MPDWSYGTFLRPLLFRLPSERARVLTLSAIGRLAALPAGPLVIDLMGHMAPPTALGRSALGLSLASPVCLAAGIDIDARATSALSRFGFGLIEIGPVTADDIMGTIERDIAARSLVRRGLGPTTAVAVVRDRLAERPMLSVVIVARLGHARADVEGATSERREIIGALRDHVAGFALDTVDDVAVGAWTIDKWIEHVAALRSALGATPFLVAIPPDTDAARAEAIARGARGAAGVIVAGGIATGDARVIGEPARTRALALVARLRERIGHGVTLIAADGIAEPRHALEALAAGATLVGLDSGFVFEGPGLPKRINEAIAVSLPTRARPAPWSLASAWSWIVLLGIGMTIGGTLAWLVAATTTVLAYEEEFVGLDRSAIAAFDPQLLAFMAHDRITLAGGMISVGILYVALALFGIRYGARWAMRAVRASAATGFASFFLFLGYRYFDPLHAIVTLLLLPFFMLGITRPLTPAVPPPANVRSDRRWRTGLWGQLAFVAIGAGLILGGGAICALGASVVFVPSDLEFARTSAVAIDAVDPRLIPLIAHDRAGLGGLLVSLGIGVLLTSLWGYREGARWLWWTYLLAGGIGFLTAVGVHFVIGYVDFLHLVPAYAAVVLFVAGLLLSLPYLWPLALRRRDEEDTEIPRDVARDERGHAHA